ncbi:FHF complex subunit HOOK interacting protein 2A-like isoform X2 [Rhincodon typus]|uniref:FHF complex subunit HOOK interacting protein 2A-like isoform X2 n=1 Tax=Rhincodon typus TaxID=259920 RepID=UPI0020304798|nr:FHF complex subunit HOOK interacting protein 2A-like isoform X2 [Rhincodon typus]
MFSKLTALLQQAVDTEEEPIQLLDSFVSHWKGITNYYIVTTDETLPVKQTDIPWRLRQMVDILVYEEKQMERGETGPCMEYLLQHKILETLCTLAKAGYPPGMKQQVLLLLTKLLGQIQQPLLPHINVHRPVQKKNSADSRKLLPCSFEKGEGQPKDAVRTGTPLSSLATGISPSHADQSPVTSIPFTPDGKDGQPDKSLINALLTLTASEKNQFALKACEGLLLLATLPEEGTARYMVESTMLRQTLADKLSDLYRQIPDTVDPGQVELLGRVNWRSHYAASNVEDAESFPGKGAVTFFFSWLDYCNQLVKEAHEVTAAAVAQEIRKRFFVTVLEPQLLQVSEMGILLSTALLMGIVTHTTSPRLLDELVFFLLGDQREAEMPTQPACHKLRSLLIERCNHLSDEISIATLRFFEQLLQKPQEHIIYNLVLRNLIGRCYIGTNTGHEERAAENEQLDETEEFEEDPFFTDIYTGSRFPASDWLVAPAAMQKTTKADGKPEVNRIVNSFLCLVPDTVKTSHLVAGCGYDTYLVDAHRMFQGCCVNAKEWKWPLFPSNLESCDPGGIFYEGDFLKVLFDRMAQILHQPYDLNLQVTSVISKVALFPHPHLHEYLLDPYINLAPSCRSLFSIIVRVIGDLMQKIQRVPQFPSKLLLVRRQLMGLEPENVVDHTTILKGVIVLEEFCKELAAISFVKYPSEPD